MAKILPFLRDFLDKHAFQYVLEVDTPGLVLKS